MGKQRIKDGMKECMVCHNFTLEEHSVHEICDICNWQNDEGAVERPNIVWGPNKMTYNEACKAWAEGKPVL